MSSLPDAERDAADVQQALAGLAALLNRLPVGESDEVLDDARQLLRDLAEDAGVAAQRVVSYLHTLRGPGDGETTVVPRRLGPYRDWVPVRGHLFGERGGSHRIGELPQPRRFDPGE